MISDIRVNVLIRGHRKRRRLEKSLGPGAMGYLIDLWIATAVSRPGGELEGWTPQDIADEVSWSGDPEKLLVALNDAGWIDRRDDGLVIVHDWTVHQGWATNSSSRSNRARMKALLRHYGEEEAFKRAREKYGFNPEDYGFMLQHDSAYAAADATALLQQKPAHAAAMLEHAAAETSNATACAAAEQHQAPAHAGVSAPSPSPSPSPSLKDSSKLLSGAKGRAGLSRKPHFSKTAGEYAEAIKAGCLKVKGLCNGTKRLNSYQWAQHWINKSGHPQAVVDSLDGLVQFWDQIRGEPWAYADKIMQTKSGNYHERDETAKSQGFKTMLAELAQMIGDIPAIGSRS